MKKIKSLHNNKKISLDFCFPYLASAQAQAAFSRRTSCQNVKNTKQRYNSASKVSHNHLLKVYIPRKEIRQVLINKSKVKSSIQNKVPTETINMLNSSLSQHRKNCFRQIKQKQQKGNPRISYSSKGYYRKNTESKDLQSTTHKQSPNQSLVKLISAFTEPVSVDLKSSFSIPGVQFKSTNKTKDFESTFKLSEPNYHSTILKNKR